MQYRFFCDLVVFSIVYLEKYQHVVHICISYNNNLLKLDLYMYHIFYDVGFTFIVFWGDFLYEKKKKAADNSRSDFLC